MYAVCGRVVAMHHVSILQQVGSLMKHEDMYCVAVDVLVVEMYIGYVVCKVVWDLFGWAITRGAIVAWSAWSMFVRYSCICCWSLLLFELSSPPYGMVIVVKLLCHAWPLAPTHWDTDSAMFIAVSTWMWWALLSNVVRITWVAWFGLLIFWCSLQWCTFCF